MIKVTLGEIKQIEEILSKLVNESLPVKISYKLSKIIPLLNAELERFEKFRVERISKYGEADEEGNTKVLPENVEVFVNEMNELMAESIDLDFDPISIDTLPDDTKLSAVEIHSLAKFLV
jgi:hypothetical protein